VPAGKFAGPHADDFQEGTAERRDRREPDLGADRLDRRGVAAEQLLGALDALRAKVIRDGAPERVAEAASEERP
jgi:hypothetical protein